MRLCDSPIDMLKNSQSQRSQIASRQIVTPCSSMGWKKWPREADWSNERSATCSRSREAGAAADGRGSACAMSGLERDDLRRYRARRNGGCFAGRSWTVCLLVWLWATRWKKIGLRAPCNSKHVRMDPRTKLCGNPSRARDGVCLQFLKRLRGPLDILSTKNQHEAQKRRNPNHLMIYFFGRRFQHLKALAWQSHKPRADKDSRTSSQVAVINAASVGLLRAARAKASGLYRPFSCLWTGSNRF